MLDYAHDLYHQWTQVLDKASYDIKFKFMVSWRQGSDHLYDFEVKLIQVVIVKPHQVVIILAGYHSVYP